jgi:hypothetical protein
VIALALLALGQFHQSHFPKVPDLVFDAVQESVVWELAGYPSRLEWLMSDRQARWVRMLGCDRYACREEAMLLLEEHYEAGYRALLWALYSPEPQVRHLALETIIRAERRNPCQGLDCERCEGSGYDGKRHAPCGYSARLDLTTWLEDGQRGFWEGVITGLKLPGDPARGPDQVRR